MYNYNYYKVLKIDSQADTNTIKVAYRKLSMVYHPDRPNGNTADFLRIKEAYDVLSDDSSRMEYDSARRRSNNHTDPVDNSTNNNSQAKDAKDGPTKSDIGIDMARKLRAFFLVSVVLFLVFTFSVLVGPSLSLQAIFKELSLNGVRIEEDTTLKQMSSIITKQRNIETFVDLNSSYEQRMLKQRIFTRVQVAHMKFDDNYFLEVIISQKYNPKAKLSFFDGIKNGILAITRTSNLAVGIIVDSIFGELKMDWRYLYKEVSNSFVFHIGPISIHENRAYSAGVLLSFITCVIMLYQIIARHTSK